MSETDLTEPKAALDRGGLLRGALAVAIAVLLSGLIYLTGGADSPFFAGYFLAALGLFWVGTRVAVAAASFVAVAGYVVAATASLGTFAPASVLLRAGLLAVFCAAVGYLGSKAWALEWRASALASFLAIEKGRAARAESLIPTLGPALRMIGLEEALLWTAKSARTLAGGSYVHVGALRGNHHHTILYSEADVCPSWQHPTIQRLLMESCRDLRVVRSDETVHGIEGFMAVPVGVAGEEPWGAIVLGGKAFDVEDEHSLRNLADGLTPALQRDGDALGGLDDISGLPNRTSLYRALQRDLSRDRTLTVLATAVQGYHDHVRRYGPAAGNDLLRRVGERFRVANWRTFRCGEDRIVVLLAGSDTKRVLSTATTVQRLASSEVVDTGRASPVPPVGFAFARADGDAGSIMDAALSALDAAKDKKGRISGPTTVTDGTRVSDERTHNGQTMGLVAVLVEALEARNPRIKGHLREVSRISLRLGQEMSLDPDQLEALTTGALLHDVGKIGIPDFVLHKPGRLTTGEYNLMKNHPTLGVAIIAPFDELSPVVPVIKHHHERFDGAGYPDGLRGDEIPQLARIVAVADAYDSMLRSRLYSRGVSSAAALEEVWRNRGTQFDPEIAKLLPLVVGDPADTPAGSAG